MTMEEGGGNEIGRLEYPIDVVLPDLTGVEQQLTSLTERFDTLTQSMSRVREPGQTLEQTAGRLGRIAAGTVPEGTRFTMSGAGPATGNLPYRPNRPSDTQDVQAYVRVLGQQLALTNETAGAIRSLSTVEAMFGERARSVTREIQNQVREAQRLAETMRAAYERAQPQSVQAATQEIAQRPALIRVAGQQYPAQAAGADLQRLAAMEGDWLGRLEQVQRSYNRISQSARNAYREMDQAQDRASRFSEGGINERIARYQGQALALERTISPALPQRPRPAQPEWITERRRQPEPQPLTPDYVGPSRTRRAAYIQREQEVGPSRQVAALRQQRQELLDYQERYTRPTSEIGQSAAQGLTQGFAAASGGVEQAARGIGDALVRGLEQSLEVSSPSRRTQRIGQDVAAGLAQGIQQGLPQIAQAAARASEAGTPARPRVRPATHEDLPFVRQVTRENPAALGFIPDSVHRDTISGRRRGQLLIGESERGERQGFLLGGPGRQAENLAYVHQLGVGQQAQGQGVASALLRAFEQWAQGIGRAGVRAGVRDDLPANAFWARQGYMPEGQYLRAEIPINRRVRRFEQPQNVPAPALRTRQSGQEAIAGLSQGIAVGASSVEQSARAMGDALARGLERALETGSPSRRTRRIGQDVAAGLAQGIESGADQVRQAAETLANPLDRIRPDAAREQVAGILAAVRGPEAAPPAIEQPQSEYERILAEDRAQDRREYFQRLIERQRGLMRAGERLGTPAELAEPERVAPPQPAVAALARAIAAPEPVATPAPITPAVEPPPAPAAAPSPPRQEPRPAPAPPQIREPESAPPRVTRGPRRPGQIAAQPGTAEYMDQWIEGLEQRIEQRAGNIRTGRVGSGRDVRRAAQERNRAQEQLAQLAGPQYLEQGTVGGVLAEARSRRAAGNFEPPEVPDLRRTGQRPRRAAEVVEDPQFGRVPGERDLHRLALGTAVGRPSALGATRELMGQAVAASQRMGENGPEQLVRAWQQVIDILSPAVNAWQTAATQTQQVADRSQQQAREWAAALSATQLRGLPTPELQRAAEALGQNPQAYGDDPRRTLMTRVRTGQRNLRELPEVVDEQPTVVQNTPTLQQLTRAVVSTRDPSEQLLRSRALREFLPGSGAAAETQQQALAALEELEQRAREALAQQAPPAVEGRAAEPLAPALTDVQRALAQQTPEAVGRGLTRRDLLARLGELGVAIPEGPRRRPQLLELMQGEAARLRGLVQTPEPPASPPAAVTIAPAQPEPAPLLTDAQRYFAQQPPEQVGRGLTRRDIQARLEGLGVAIPEETRRRPQLLELLQTEAARLRGTQTLQPEEAPPAAAVPAPQPAPLPARVEPPSLPAPPLPPPPPTEPPTAIAQPQPEPEPEPTPRAAPEWVTLSNAQLIRRAMAGMRAAEARVNELRERRRNVLGQRTPGVAAQQLERDITAAVAEADGLARALEELVNQPQAADILQELPGPTAATSQAAAEPEQGPSPVQRRLQRLGLQQYEGRLREMAAQRVFPAEATRQLSSLMGGQPLVEATIRNARQGTGAPEFVGISREQLYGRVRSALAAIRSEQDAQELAARRDVETVPAAALPQPADTSTSPRAQDVLREAVAAGRQALEQRAPGRTLGARFPQPGDLGATIRGLVERNLNTLFGEPQPTNRLIPEPRQARTVRVAPRGLEPIPGIARVDEAARLARGRTEAAELQRRATELAGLATRPAGYRLEPGLEGISGRVLELGGGGNVLDQLQRALSPAAREQFEQARGRLTREESARIAGARYAAEAPRRTLETQGQTPGREYNTAAVMSALTGRLTDIIASDLGTRGFGGLRFTDVEPRTGEPREFGAAVTPVIGPRGEAAQPAEASVERYMREQGVGRERALAELPAVSAGTQLRSQLEQMRGDIARRIRALTAGPEAAPGREFAYGVGGGRFTPRGEPQRERESAAQSIESEIQELRQSMQAADSRQQEELDQLQTAMATLSRALEQTEPVAQQERRQGLIAAAAEPRQRERTRAERERREFPNRPGVRQQLYAGAPPTGAQIEVIGGQYAGSTGTVRGVVEFPREAGGPSVEMWTPGGRQIMAPLGRAGSFSYRTIRPAPEAQPAAAQTAPSAVGETPQPTGAQQTQLVLTPTVDQAQLARVERQVTESVQRVAQPTVGRVGPIDPNLLVGGVAAPPAATPTAQATQQNAIEELRDSIREAISGGLESLEGIGESLRQPLDAGGDEIQEAAGQGAEATQAAAERLTQAAEQSVTAAQGHRESAQAETQASRSAGGVLTQAGTELRQAGSELRGATRGGPAGGAQPAAAPQATLRELQARYETGQPLTGPEQAQVEAVQQASQAARANAAALNLEDQAIRDKLPLLAQLALAERGAGDSASASGEAIRQNGELVVASSRQMQQLPPAVRALREQYGQRAGSLDALRLAVGRGFRGQPTGPSAFDPTPASNVDPRTGRLTLPFVRYPDVALGEDPAEREQFARSRQERDALAESVRAARRSVRESQALGGLPNQPGEPGGPGVSYPALAGVPDSGNEGRIAAGQWVQATEQRIAQLQQEGIASARVRDAENRLADVVDRAARDEQLRLNARPEALAARLQQIETRPIVVGVQGYQIPAPAAGSFEEQQMQAQARAEAAYNAQSLAANERIQRPGRLAGEQETARLRAAEAVRTPEQIRRAIVENYPEQADEILRRARSQAGRTGGLTRQQQALPEAQRVAQLGESGVNVVLDADNTRYVRAINQAIAENQQLQRSIAETAGSAGRGGGGAFGALGESLQSIDRLFHGASGDAIRFIADLAGLGIGISVIAGVARILNQSIATAIQTQVQWQTAIRATTAAFGQQAGAYEQMATTLSRTPGINADRQQILQQIGTGAAFARNFRLPEQAIGITGQEQPIGEALAAHADRLSTIFGGQPEQAQGALQQALLGQGEQLRQLTQGAVNLTPAALAERSGLVSPQAAQGMTEEQLAQIWLAAFPTEVEQRAELLRVAQEELATAEQRSATAASGLVAQQELAAQNTRRIWQEVGQVAGNVAEGVLAQFNRMSDIIGNAAQGQYPGGAAGQAVGPAVLAGAPLVAPLVARALTQGLPEGTGFLEGAGTLLRGGAGRVLPFAGLALGGLQASQQLQQGQQVSALQTAAGAAGGVGGALLGAEVGGGIGALFGGVGAVPGAALGALLFGLGGGALAGQLAGPIAQGLGLQNTQQQPGAATQSPEQQAAADAVRSATEHAQALRLTTDAQENDTRAVNESAAAKTRETQTTVALTAAARDFAAATQVAANQIQLIQQRMGTEIQVAQATRGPFYPLAPAPPEAAAGGALDLLRQYREQQAALGNGPGQDQNTLAGTLRTLQDTAAQAPDAVAPGGVLPAQQELDFLTRQLFYEGQLQQVENVRAVNQQRLGEAQNQLDDISAQHQHDLLDTYDGQISRQQELVDLRLQAIDLEGRLQEDQLAQAQVQQQIMVASRTNLDSERQLLLARQAQLPVLEEQNALQYRQTLASQQIRATVANLALGRATPEAVRALPTEILEQYRAGLEVTAQAPAVTQAAQGVQQREFVTQGEALTRDLNLNTLEGARRAVEDRTTQDQIDLQVINLREGQINREVERLDLAREAQREKAQLALLDAQAVERLAQQREREIAAARTGLDIATATTDQLLQQLSITALIAAGAQAVNTAVARAQPPQPETPPEPTTTGGAVGLPPQTPGGTGATGVTLAPGTPGGPPDIGGANPITPVGRQAAGPAPIAWDAAGNPTQYQMPDGTLVSADQLNRTAPQGPAPTGTPIGLPQVDWGAVGGALQQGLDILRQVATATPSVGAGGAPDIPSTPEIQAQSDANQRAAEQNRQAAQVQLDAATQNQQTSADDRAARSDQLNQEQQYDQARTARLQQLILNGPQAAPQPDTAPITDQQLPTAADTVHGVMIPGTQQDGGLVATPQGAVDWVRNNTPPAVPEGVRTPTGTQQSSIQFNLNINGDTTLNSTDEIDARANAIADVARQQAFEQARQYLRNVMSGRPGGLQRTIPGARQ